MTQAAWVLVAAFVLSFVYEVYRATAKAGTSQHDSMRAFVKNNIALYVEVAIGIDSHKSTLAAAAVWTLSAECSGSGNSATSPKGTALS